MSHFPISDTVKEPDPKKLQEGGLKEAISFLSPCPSTTGIPTEIQPPEVSIWDRKKKFEKIAVGGSRGKIMHSSCLINELYRNDKESYRDILAMYNTAK